MRTAAAASANRDDLAEIHAIERFHCRRDDQRRLLRMPPLGDYLIKRAEHRFAPLFEIAADEIEEDNLMAQAFQTSHPLEDKHILPTPAHRAVPNDVLKED